MINLINLSSKHFHITKIKHYYYCFSQLAGTSAVCLAAGDDTHDDEKQKMTTFIRILLLYFLEDKCM